ncbi:hypothetical protein ACFP2F_12480 [Hymenobacter artigasi]|uniref:DUF805 domain-containing protein n=1 Tax=Hymenobacter artigasi TaxID=2719616 RepID=A0ABX1HHL8_9BACT|nr:hypothetical protein [Hymenobacter artigasi]NKI88268.1 hypothetical protein [Hymenobacter artigasi]
MPTAPAAIAPPWDITYTIWGRSALLNTGIYGAVCVFAGGGGGVGLALLTGLISAIISLPAIVVLRWLLPIVLAIKSRQWRITGVLGFVTLLYLVLAIPVSMALSVGSDDANPVQLTWSATAFVLAFTSPCLAGTLIAAGHTCRTLLFRPDSLVSNAANT